MKTQTQPEHRNASRHQPRLLACLCLAAAAVSLPSCISVTREVREVPVKEVRTTTHSHAPTASSTTTVTTQR